MISKGKRLVRVLAWALFGAFLVGLSYLLYVVAIERWYSDIYPSGMTGEEFYRFEWPIGPLLIFGAGVGVALAIYSWRRSAR